MLLLAVVCVAAGVIGLARRSKAKSFNVMLLVEGVVFLAWGVLAGGGGVDGWSAAANDISYNWAIQTVVVILGGACVWLWAAGNPERAELTTWNTHQVWKLYRANWQGMVGLGILVVFMLMALLAPFLADHALLDPNAQIKDPATGELFGPYHPPTDVLLQLVRHRPGGAERARAVHLERAHLAHGRPAGRLHVHRPRRRHRHRRRLLRGLAGRGLDALNRRVPGHPVAAAGDGARRRLGPELLDDHPHHRHHQLAGHRARDPLGHAARARAAASSSAPRRSARATGTS